MHIFFTILDWLVFIPLSCCVAYMLFYAIASHFYRQPPYANANTLNRFAIVFPAYKEDRVILKSIKTFLEQDYPKDRYDIIVVSDHMTQETNASLKQLPIITLEATYENSSKAKALILATEYLEKVNYDAIVIMDADNLTVPFFLKEINKAFNCGVKAMQARRTGEHCNTEVAQLDSTSEEINNSFFRSGHNAVGLSSALSGSGMAFDFNWFSENVRNLQTAGEDKELEVLLLKNRIHVSYLKNLPVFDEKIAKSEDIGNQRKRWIAVQYATLARVYKDFPKALFQGNFDYCDKIIQWMLPPRLIQIAAIGLCTILALLLDPIPTGIRWTILCTVQVSAFLIALPSSYYNITLLKAILLKLPYLILITIKNMFRLKGASKKFIHTKHGD